ncbi:hypothetical protein B0A54_04018 [Friedmanniomyces endolithicus]|uniref:Uncharacterized protein n=1 Tax=Friedmanniomyces endolithicus TaxID=329885 RepID=A0A4V5N8Y2_9PEZI|nr:hypothetical protein B0A54_04018 [Friedmanniomyces endolithicus]
MATIRSSIPHEDRTATEPRENRLEPVVLSHIREVNDNVRLLRLNAIDPNHTIKVRLLQSDCDDLNSTLTEPHPLISIFSYLIRSVTRPKEIHFIYTTRVSPSSGDIDPQTILFLPRLMDLVAAIAQPTNITLSVFLTGPAAEGAATDDRGIIEHGKLPNRTFGRRVTEADLPTYATTSLSSQAFISCSQKGRLYAQFSLQDASDFRATVRDIDQNDFRQTYSHLAQSRMPPTHLTNAALTPLPDAPDDGATSAPIFAVQANVIKGGLLVALYLHHSIADIHSLAQIIQLMSNPNTATRTLSNETLRTDAKTQSTLRARLSGTWGANPEPTEHSRKATQRKELSQLTGQERGVCHILAFDLAALEQTRAALNTRFHDFQGDHPIHISAFDCLAAILWKAITRASWPRGPPGDDPGRFVKLTVPVGIRNRVPSLRLPQDYFGNAVLHAEAYSRVVELRTGFDAVALAHTARQVRVAVGRITEGVIQANIAGINSLEDASEAAVSNRRFDANLVGGPSDERGGCWVGYGTWSAVVGEEDGEGERGVWVYCAAGEEEGGGVGGAGHVDGRGDGEDVGRWGIDEVCELGRVMSSAIKRKSAAIGIFP